MKPCLCKVGNFQQQTLSVCFFYQKFKWEGTWTKNRFLQTAREVLPIINFSLICVASRLIELETLLLPFYNEPETIFGQSEVKVATCAPKSSWHLALPVSVIVKMNPEFISKRSFKRDDAFVWNMFSCFVFWGHIYQQKKHK